MVMLSSDQHFLGWITNTSKSPKSPVSPSVQPCLILISVLQEVGTKVMNIKQTLESDTTTKLQ